MTWKRSTLRLGVGKVQVSRNRQRLQACRNYWIPRRQPERRKAMGNWLNGTNTVDGARNYDEATTCKPVHRAITSRNWICLQPAGV
jgi:hypothetical protein